MICDIGDIVRLGNKHGKVVYRGLTRYGKPVVKIVWMDLTETLETSFRGMQVVGKQKKVFNYDMETKKKE